MPTLVAAAGDSKAFDASLAASSHPASTLPTSAAATEVAPVIVNVEASAAEVSSPPMSISGSLHTTADAGQHRPDMPSEETPFPLPAARGIAALSGGSIRAARRMWNYIIDEEGAELAATAAATAAASGDVAPTASSNSSLSAGAGGSGWPISLPHNMSDASMQVTLRISVEGAIDTLRAVALIIATHTCQAKQARCKRKIRA